MSASSELPESTVTDAAAVSKEQPPSVADIDVSTATANGDGADAGTNDTTQPSAYESTAPTVTTDDSAPSESPAPSPRPLESAPASSVSTPNTVTASATPADSAPASPRSPKPAATATATNTATNTAAAKPTAKAPTKPAAAVSKPAAVKPATATPPRVSASPPPTQPAASALSSMSMSMGMGGGLSWRSMLGLGETVNTALLADWLPEYGADVSLSIFPLTPQPPPPTTAPAVAPTELPPLVSILPPPPLPSSPLRFGWIDEYGDYHPLPSSQLAKVNPRMQKAKEIAKESITAILTQQERLEAQREPGSPRVSAIIKNQSIDSSAAQVAIVGTNAALNATAQAALNGTAIPDKKDANELGDETI